MKLYFVCTLCETKIFNDIENDDNNDFNFKNNPGGDEIYSEFISQCR